MKYYFLLFTFCFFIKINCQEYFNKKFVFEDKFITILNLSQIDDTYYLTSFLFFSEDNSISTGLLKYKLSNDIESFIEYLNFGISEKGIQNNSNKLFLFGKNRSSLKELKSINIDLHNFSTLQANSFYSEGEYS
ncbi:MAG: hypothetical protein KDC16_01710, partial [Saprospiraceae bacterium]|nr:hypothetical protein [Saprospiraceae bacterium]